MTEPISGSPLHPRLKHHASDPTDLSSMNKSPVKFLSLEEDLPPSGKWLHIVYIHVLYVILFICQGILY